MPSFLAPLFLAGIGALAVPLLVHLVNRQQKEPIRFPSLMFLEDIPYRDVKRQRIRHWLLLLIRCLILLLLALAFARPFFRGADTGLAANAATTGRDIVILLDRSYSMEYGDRWARATAAARRVIEEMQDGDRAAVVYFMETATAATPLTSERAALQRAIDSAQPTAGATRFDAAIRAATRIFGDSSQSRREVVLISDYQRTGLDDHRVAKLPSGTQFIPVYLGDNAASNLSISRAELRYDSAGGRERAIITVNLTNRGPNNLVHRPVTLELNGRKIQTQLVDIPANGSAYAEFDGFPVPPGMSPGVIDAGNDSLPRDNRFYFVVAPKAPVRVLLIQPSNADTRASLFLTEALRIGRPPAFDVQVVSADRLSVNTLRGHTVVILNGAPWPAGPVGLELARYVRRGGGLLVALGANSNPTKWPATADSLLPRVETRPVDRLDDNGISVSFIDLGHPIFEVFRTSRSGNFSAARILQYWNVAADPGDRQLARFGDGRMALVERTVGNGRVLVWSSDFDGLWNDLPLQSVFLPFLHQMVSYAAGSTVDRPWFTVGQVADAEQLLGAQVTADHDERSTGIAISNASFTVHSPDGTQTRHDITDAPELTSQGIYELQRSTEDETISKLIAVNLDPVESDLGSLDTALVRASVISESVTEPTSTTAAGLQSPEIREERHRFWWILLISMLVMLGIETLVSNRLSRSGH